ncbi:MAG: hypothetical protein ACI4CT_08015 [Lachnospiraceae bacterium]
MTEIMIDDIILLKKLTYWGGTLMNLTLIQISVFGSFRDIQPEQNNLIKLITGLPGFIPGTSQHLSIDAASGKVENLQRIVMNNNVNGWRLEVQPDRLNAVYSVTSDVSEQVSRDDLVHIGIEYLKTCIDILNIDRRFTRLAINAQYVDPTGKVTPNIPFNACLPSYISSIDEVCEWNLTLNRNGQVIINNVEKTNEILSCSLGSSLADPIDHARLITIDINTLQNVLVERFNINDMNKFAHYALSRWDAMLSNL